MAKQKPRQGGNVGQQKSQEQKLAEVREGLKSGTTKPLPTPDDTPPEERAEVKEKIDELTAKAKEREEKERAELEELEAKMKAIKDEMKARKDAIKAERDAERESKKAEKDQALAERNKKAILIEEADERIKAAEKALKLTEEFAEFAAAKKAREEVGPLPKVPKGGGGGGSKGPRKRASNGLTPKMVRLLKVMADGVARGSAELADLSDIAKGKPFPEMYDMGIIDITVPDEGERGRRFSITDKGREALEKALSEDDSSED